MTTISLISRRANAGLGAVLLALVALSEGAAQADMPPAEKLFREGRDLMNRGKLTEACLHFAQSLAIADEVGPRMNLALCEEKRGHLLAALSGFEIVEQRARELRDLQIAEVAASHIKALRARVPSVIVRGVLSPGSRLVLRRPNHPDLEIEAGVSVPQDPSDPSTDDRVHVRVTAGTRHTFESAPIALAEGTQSEIELPGPASPSVRPPAKHELVGHQQRGYLLLAGGLQLLTGSVAYGLWQRDEALEVGCITVASCVDDHNHNLRVWGSTLFATGITLTVAGVYYAFIQPARRATSRTTAFTPLITHDTIGLVWGTDL